MKILSQNFSLGLPNKIDIAMKWTSHYKPNVFVIQEAEIMKSTNLNIMQQTGYTLVTSLSPTNDKARIAVYIKDSDNFKVKIDTRTETIKISNDQHEIFAVYKPFKIHTNQREYVDLIIKFIEENIIQPDKLIIVGDFNMDYSRRNDPKYVNHKLLKKWLSFIDSLGLIQQVDQCTWKRSVLNKVKSSILDHSYVSNDSFRTSIIDLQVGDHLGLLISDQPKNNHRRPQKRLRRIWRKYSPDKLISEIDENILEAITGDDIEVQNLLLSQHIMKSLDKLAPEILIKRDETNLIWSEKLIRLRRKKNNLIKKARNNNDHNFIKKSRALDKHFRKTITEEKRNKVKNMCNEHNGSPSNFWKAVNLAANKSSTHEVATLTLRDREYTDVKTFPSIFMDAFNDKLERLQSNPRPAVYNGTPKTLTGNFSITADRLQKAFKSLSSSKTSFGTDRVPIRVLKDSAPKTFSCILNLFNKIWETKTVPHIWKVSRVIPIHKKGPKTEAENYRPISNLCSIAKLFEKCILSIINDYQTTNEVDLTHKNQYGFKKGKSTAKLALQIQHRIACEIDAGKIVSVLSLDLSSAFDIVNIDLLNTRLIQIGLPNELCQTINDWLSGRLSYVEYGQHSSNIYEVKTGTVQGSIMGPMLFSLFISPIFDLIDILAYADDNYLICSNKDLGSLLNETENKANSAVNWLRDSGLSVNSEKTELVLFSTRNQQGTITIESHQIKSQQTMKILGIIFDEKLEWEHHIDNAILKTKSATSGLRHLAKYIDQEKMMQLATSFAYSRLYYGAEVWLVPSISSNNWKRLLSASTSVIRSSLRLFDWKISYRDFHELAGRATPRMMCDYLTALSLQDHLKSDNDNKLSIDLKKNYRVHVRKDIFYFANSNRTRIGSNSLMYRAGSVANKIKSSSFGLDRDRFKTLMKKTFLN